MSHSYRVYGLAIRSEIPLPELLPGDGGEDVVVRVGRVEPLPPPEAGRRGRLKIDEDEIVLAVDDVGVFLMRGGREIVVDAVPGIESPVLRLMILGSALGILLHQRGMLALHASAVEIGGRAVLFLGESGRGKSTTAAAFHRVGHRLITDDIAVVHGVEGASVVSPGFPLIKLRPDAIDALGHEPEGLLRFHPELPKRGLVKGIEIVDTTLPLSCVYVLARGEQVKVQGLTPQAALAELIRHTYAIGLLKARLAASGHLVQISALIGRIPVRRLYSGDSLERIGEVVALVERDMKVRT